MLLTISFELDRVARSVVPLVGGRPLSELVAEFESAAGMEPSGGYGGVVMSSSDFGPLDAYYFGAVDEHLDDGLVELLSCEAWVRPGAGLWRRLS